jgi:hypothetical protein
MSNINAPSYKALLKRYNASSDDVKRYFDLLPSILENYPESVALAYLFFQTEKAQNRMLYGGVVKLHHANAKVVESIVHITHITRESFLQLFKNIFGEDLPAATSSKIKEAERTRDKLLHGKNVTPKNMREAIFEVLDYAEAMNSDVDRLAGFKPFGDMRGFKGRGVSLDASTTRWLMKGLGFTAS